MPKKRKAALASSGSLQAKKMNLFWRCEQCERVFRTEQGLDSHIDSVHNCHVPVDEQSCDDWKKISLKQIEIYCYLLRNE